MGGFPMGGFMGMGGFPQVGPPPALPVQQEAAPVNEPKPEVSVCIT